MNSPRLALAVPILALALLAQLHRPDEFQARSPEEYDAYLEVEAAQGAGARIRLAGEFLKRWPESALRPPVLVWKMDAHRERDEGEQALAAAEQAVELARDHVPAMVGLSELLVNLCNDTVSLDRARGLAERLLRLLDGGIDVPRTVPPEAWLRLKQGYEARAWSVIGHGAYKQGRARKAIQAFETAIGAEPEYDAARHFRYAMLLQASGKADQARQELERLLRQAPPLLRDRARQALQSLR
jgi:tetratricopeptide (TPR) repeat protein